MAAAEQPDIVRTKQNVAEAMRKEEVNVVGASPHESRFLRISRLFLVGLKLFVGRYRRPSSAVSSHTDVVYQELGGRLKKSR